MLTELEIINIGPFDGRGVRLEFKPLTIIVGPNNVGKSSLIYSYDLVSSMGAFPPRHVRTFIDFPSLIHNHDVSSQGKVSAQYTGLKNTNVEIRAHLELKRQNAPLMEYIVNGSQPVDNRMTPDQKKDYADANNFFSNTTYLLANRSFISPFTGIGSQNQPTTLNPEGSNITQFLLYKWTDRDPNWPEAEYWLKKIDPYVNLMKTPLIGNTASLVTERGVDKEALEVNVALQGSGIQRALQIISALVFTPLNSCIIIEEPEMNLHPKAQEIIADLINKAINEWQKQVIITTHSWDMLMPYASDLGLANARNSKEHVIADKNKVTLCILEYKEGRVQARNDLEYGKFSDFKKDLKTVWG